jgi:hypothetical protein
MKEAMTGSISSDNKWHKGTSLMMRFPSLEAVLWVIADAARDSQVSIFRHGTSGTYSGTFVPREPDMMGAAKLKGAVLTSLRGDDVAGKYLSQSIKYWRSHR